MNVSEAIKRGSNILKKNGIKTYQLDCEILISQVFKKNRIDMILNSSKKLSDKQIILFNDLIEQRSKKKPVAYLIGKKEFWKYEFEVTKDVLIPRPDTEILIEQTLKITNHKSRLKILDIGIGSGCILLTILKERKSYYGTGIDISKKTLDICSVNVKKLNLFNRIRLFKSDVDNFSSGKYDLIISNPPYIKKFDLKYLEKDIYDYEPKSALDGGLDGLLQIKKVIINSSKLIKKNGILILEIAFNQTDRVKKILKDNGYFIRDVVKDLAKNNRCIISIKK
tara:strand:+ start:3502 stop:4344 length:843 start_codon:yes stop_codon:yes gene_type:complete